MSVDHDHANAEILLATYNGEAYLRKQLDSILHQSDPRWHLTISDDGSSDHTQEIISDYAHAYPNQIRVVRSGEAFSNARDHFFYLMAQCDAPYIMFCDQDDVWYPEKVGVTLQALMAAEQELPAGTPVLVFTDLMPVDDRLRPIAASLSRYQKQFVDSFDYRSLLMQNVVTGCAMGINRALKTLGSECADSRDTLMHDWWLGVVAARFGKVVYLDQPTVSYRQHRDNAVGVKNVGSMAYICTMIKNWKAVADTIRAKKKQAMCFHNTYAPMLTLEDKAFLNAFVKPRSGVRFYWQNSALIHGLNRKIGLMLLG